VLIIAFKLYIGTANGRNGSTHETERLRVGDLWTKFSMAQLSRTIATL
jgi:hypothetical protein